MKRLLLFLSLVAIFVSLSAQTGKLPYKKVIQAYRGDTLYTEFDGDSVRVVTNKKWAFNPEISGGETLGNPSVSNMLLKSTTAGVRSWGWPDRIRNYNLIDTGIVIRTVPAGKIGSYTRIVNMGGIYNLIDTVNGGMVGFINENLSGMAYFIAINSAEAYKIYINNPSGKAFFIDENNSNSFYCQQNKNGGYVGHVYANNNGGKAFIVDFNQSGGVVNQVLYNNGIFNSVNNVKNNTVGLHEVISGRVYYDGIQKWYRDSIGLSHGEIPSATGQDTTVNLSVDLTADTWVKVTNSTNNLWSLSNTAAYMTFSNDTIINTYAGKYEYYFNLSVNGKDGATYEYRVRKKTGTTVSTIRKLKVTGAGINSERMIDCMPLLSAGDRVWLEVRFTGAPTGSPVLIFGSYFTAKAVYLSL